MRVAPYAFRDSDRSLPFNGKGGVGAGCLVFGDYYRPPPRNSKLPLQVIGDLLEVVSGRYAPRYNLLNGIEIF